MTARNALLGACLALSLAAHAGSALAGPSSDTPTITVPPGAVVLILPAADAVTMSSTPAGTVLPAGDPLLRMVAEQDAMMGHMMAKMNAAFAQPMWPTQMDQMIRAAFGTMPANAAGSGVIFTSISGGPGVCSERVTYAYPGNGAKPQVTMSRSGDACGSLGATGPRSVMQPLPAQRPEAPVAQPSGPHLWTVSDPPQQIVTSKPPQS
jgi:hypothetical protein